MNNDLCDNCQNFADRIGEYCFDCVEKNTKSLIDEIERLNAKIAALEVSNRAETYFAFSRGAETMREQCALLFDGGDGIPGLAKIHGYRDFIRELPLPKE
jgi:hypothetical protein